MGIVSHNPHAINSIMPDTQRSLAETQEIIARVQSRGANALSLLFPDAISRERARGELAMVAKDYEYRIKAMEIARETSIRVLTASLNHFVRNGETALQNETAAVVMQQLSVFEERANKQLESLTDTILKAYEKADAITNDRVRQMRYEAIDKGLAGFSLMVDTLREQFMAIVNSSVRSPSGA